MSRRQEDALQRRHRNDPTGSGRAIWSLATRTLRRYECGYCGQRLDRLRKSAKACARIYPLPDGRECDWHEFLQPENHRDD